MTKDSTIVNNFYFEEIEVLLSSGLKIGFWLASILIGLILTLLLSVGFVVAVIIYFG